MIGKQLVAVCAAVAMVQGCATTDPNVSPPAPPAMDVAPREITLMVPAAKPSVKDPQDPLELVHLALWLSDHGEYAVAGQYFGRVGRAQPVTLPDGAFNTFAADMLIAALVCHLLESDDAAFLDVIQELRDRVGPERWSVFSTTPAGKLLLAVEDLFQKRVPLSRILTPGGLR